MGWDKALRNPGLSQPHGDWLHQLSLVDTVLRPLMQTGSGNGSIVARHSQLTYFSNNPIQGTRATKRLGVLKFRVVARGADRGR